MPRRGRREAVWVAKEEGRRLVGAPSASGDALRAVALELGARADEIRAGADWLMAVSAMLGHDGTPPEVSREIAMALLGVTHVDRPSAPPPQRLGLPAPGRDVQGRSQVDRLKRRLWDRTPLVVVEAATVRSFGQSVLCSVGIDASGKKHVLGLAFKATSSQQGPSVAFVEDLFGRGVKAADGHHLLFVTDGGVALDQAIERRYPGSHLGLCHAALRERVLAHLRHTPAELQTRSELGRALGQAQPDEIRRHLDRLGQSLSLSHPGAAASVREGLRGALVLAGLGPSPALYRSLATVSVLRTAIAEAAHLGRSQTALEGEDAMALGVERWEEKTRRLMGYEGLEALSLALRSPSRAA